MNLTNLQQENGMLSMIKIKHTMVKWMKMAQPLNLKPKSLNQIYDYSDAYILVAGDIEATNGDENTKVAFKNCVPFTKCITLSILIL